MITAILAKLDECGNLEKPNNDKNGKCDSFLHSHREEGLNGRRYYGSRQVVYYRTIGGRIFELRQLGAVAAERLQ